MLSPITDIFKYIKMYQSYLGKRIYLIFALGLLASLSEGFGILMMIPLLETLDGSSIDPSDGFASKILYSIVIFLGLDNSTLTILIVITFSFFLKGLMTFGAMTINAILRGRLLRELKGMLFDNYTNMSYEYYSSKDTGHFINLINEQPTRALEAFSQLTTLGGQIINTVVLMTLAFLMTWQFGSMAIIVGILLLIIFVKLTAYVRSLSRLTASENGTLTKWLIQTLHAFKYLGATGQTFALKERITKSIEKLTKNQVGMDIAAAFTHSIKEPIAVIFIMAIVYIQILIFDNSLEPILVSIVLFYRALNSVLGIQSAFQGTFVHIGSMEIVDDEFKQQKINQAINGSNLIKSFKQDISFDQVSFSYRNENKKVLQDISLKINANQAIAIVGESGSGKSTLADLLSLMLAPSKGKIIIDGIDTQDLEKNSWRSQLGYVSQETIIFDDTIGNNICMWKGDYNINEDIFNDILKAAKSANILELIDSLEDGLNSMVGDRGIKLSGGQKQRLFIARELFRKPNLLILDEATSALDSQSEEKIQKSIDGLMGKVTVVVIAHRLSTIKNVDLIYVLQDGKLIENGSYSELIKNKDSNFSKMIKLQSFNNI
jgi:ABC-type multidrug transport system fused ATPase/permease subunit